MSETLTFTRNLSVPKSALDEARRRAKVTFSSEAAVFMGGFYEILSHDDGAANLDRLNSGAALLFNHNWDDQIGAVVEAHIAGRKGHATIEFGISQRAGEFWEETKMGHRSNFSFGYEYRREDTEYVGEKDGFDIVKVNRWTVFELSTVSIPAQPDVGLGRTLTNHKSTNINTMTQPNNESVVTATRAAKPNEADRLNEIRAVSNNMRNLAGEYFPNGNRELNALLEEKTAQAIDSNWKIEAFRDWAGEVFTERIKLARPKSSGPIVVERPDFGQSELDGFSFARMITGLASGKFDGLEREMSDEAALKSRRSQPAGGAFIPASVLSHRAGGQGRRDMYAGVDSAGGYAVGHTEAMSFIDLLRASSLVLELGATELNGLQGEYSESKLTGGVSATWLEEGEASTESTPTWGQVKLRARRVCADVEFSESLAMNTNANIEMRVRKLIADQLSQAIDIAAINGDGAGSTPLGIMNTTGIGAIEAGNPDGAAVTYADLIDLEGEIDVDNAMTGAPAFLTNTSVKKKLRQTLRETTNGSDGSKRPALRSGRRLPLRSL